MKLSPTKGAPGSKVQAVVSGFQAGQVVKLHWSTKAGTVLVKVKTDAKGSAAVHFNVPAGTSGKHTVFAMGKGGPTAGAVFRS